MKHSFLALLLAVALLLPLASCGSQEIVMRYGSAEVTMNMYRYWLSSYKATFLRTYTDMEDTDDFWLSELTDTQTAEEFLNDMVAENVKRTLICAALFDEYKLKLSDDSVQEIDDYIEDLITEQANGSRTVFNQTLSQYGININMLREIYQMEEKASYVYDYLYGENGTNALTDTDYEQYYQENYVRVHHIWVNDAYRYDMDEDGNYKTDSSGSLVTRSLTTEEQKTANETITAIQNAISAGKDFTEIWETYSEDTYYPNGYYLTADTNFIDVVVDAAVAMKVGDVQKVVSDYGTHFLYKVSLDAGAWQDEDNTDFFDSFQSDAASAAFMTFLDNLLSSVEVDEELRQTYSIRTVSTNYDI